MARKYLRRDVHEAFFRNGAGGKRKRGRHKSKKPFEKKIRLTDKQRAAAARAHYKLHYGDNSDYNNISFAPWNSPMVVLGHHNNDDDTGHMDLTIPLTPPPLREITQYHENISTDHENLIKVCNLP